MGNKYSIYARMSGYCSTNQTERSTKYFIAALLWLTIFKTKYPIVDFAVRNGYKNCDKCKHTGLLCKTTE